MSPAAPFSVTRKTLVDQVAEGLVDFVLNNRLKEGDALPSTADLADRFSVSRTVVREAIADLNARGILVRSHGKECVVGTPGPEELHRLLSFRIRRDNVDLMDVQTIREALEVMSAKLAAEHRTPEHVERMQAHLGEQEAAGNDLTFHDADVAFHRVMAEASDNLLLLLMLDSLTPLLIEERIRATAGRRRAGLDEDFGPIIEAHRDVLRAIEAGKPDRAAAAMERHLRQVREGLQIAEQVPGRRAPRARAARA